MVFIIAAEVYAFGAAVFLLLASGKKQPWADGYTHDKLETSISEDSLLEKTNTNKINLSTSADNT